MEMAKGMALYWLWLPVSQLQPEIGAVILSLLHQIYLGQNPEPTPEPGWMVLLQQ